MNRHLKFIACVVATGCSLVSVALAAEQKPIGPQGDTYASIAKLPDWSGVWVIPFTAFRSELTRHRNPASPDAPPFASEDASKQAGPGNPKPPLQNGESCLPSGMPNVMRYAFGIEFLFSPGRVTMLLEQEASIRRIYTDDTPHSKDPDLTYTGDSIGHWEGETLVIHTTAISPRAELLAGIRTSGKAQVTERIHLVDKDHLQIDTVVEDSIALKAPWRYSRIHERSNLRISEWVCMGNNRDMHGGEPDLTPPKE